MTLTSPRIVAPRGGRLSFQHNVATELAFDGGTLAIKVNRGKFRAVPTRAFRFNPPNLRLATVDEGNTNPLAGRRSWTGSDGGQVVSRWGQTQVNLGKMGIDRGDRIRLRFAFGMDGCGGVTGWYVDNIRVTVCRPSGRSVGRNDD
jgi:hypothetical protein